MDTTGIVRSSLDSSRSPFWVDNDEKSDESRVDHPTYAPNNLAAVDSIEHHFRVLYPLDDYRDPPSTTIPEVPAELPGNRTISRMDSSCLELCCNIHKRCWAVMGSIAGSTLSLAGFVTTSVIAPVVSGRLITITYEVRCPCCNYCP